MLTIITYVETVNIPFVFVDTGTTYLQINTKQPNNIGILLHTAVIT